MLEQTPGRTCGPMETGAHDGSALLAGLANSMGDSIWYSAFLKDCIPRKGPALGIL